jgi:hypothetical protein
LRDTQIHSTGGQQEKLHRQAWMKLRKDKEADIIDFIQSLSNDQGCRGKAWEEANPSSYRICGSSGYTSQLGNRRNLQKFLYWPKQRRSNIFQDWETSNPGGKIRLLFIVHPSGFREFSKQSYKYHDVDPNGNSIKATKEKPRNAAKVKEQRKKKAELQVIQHVLEVDLEGRLRKLRGFGAKRAVSEVDGDVDERPTKRQRGVEIDSA